MRKILLFGLLLASNLNAATYCENFQWDSSTKFEGPVGKTGDIGIRR
jgi:hypothetical protein